jgi:hypothetical protein
MNRMPASLGSESAEVLGDATRCTLRAVAELRQAGRLPLMSRALILVLVLVLALLSLPVLVSMDGMDPCPACGGAGMLGMWGLCFAVISLFAVLLPTSMTALRISPVGPRTRLAVTGVERPPRIT